MATTRNNRKAEKPGRKDFATHDGHRLTPNEAKFIDRYILTGNGAQSVVDAGYKMKVPARHAQTLLNKPYINSEINYRLERLKTDAIADAKEVLEYLTRVMRGEIKDQFGLDAPLSERTKAAQELAKRTIDVQNKAKQVSGDSITVTLIRRGEE